MTGVLQNLASPQYIAELMEISSLYIAERCCFAALLYFLLKAYDNMFFRDEKFRLVEEPVKASVLTLSAECWEKSEKYYLFD